MIFIKKKSTNYQCFFLELLCEYLKAEQFTDLQVVYLNEKHQQYFNIDTTPQMLDNDNNCLISLPKITKTLLQEMNLDMDLMGYTDEDVQQCMQYFEMTHTHKDQYDQLLPALESELKGNTFLCNRMNLGVPDLLLFAFLYRPFLDLENEDKKDMPELYRWFNYIQNLRGIKNFLEKKNYPLIKEIDWTIENKKGGKKKKKNQKQNKKSQ